MKHRASARGGQECLPRRSDNMQVGNKQIEKGMYLCDIPLHSSQVGPEVDKRQDDAHAVGICLSKDQIQALQ